MSKKLAFAPVASALTGAHRDYLILVSDAQQPEIQCLVSGVKSFPVTSHHGCTHNYNLNIMIYRIFTKMGRINCRNLYVAVLGRNPRLFREGQI